MRIKALGRRAAGAKLKGEESRLMLDDIDTLTPSQLKTYLRQAYMHLQLSRLTRDELKAIIGYTATRIRESNSK